MSQMLRNSLSHGIEQTDIRLKNNKSAEGTITLENRIDDNRLIISFKDDGAGINPEHIRRKAVELNLYTLEESRKLSGSELIKMIFRPGFSTTENPDLSSGQGIGMNSIKKMISESDGKISIKTKPGKFTEFIMSFALNPLSA